jgi:hypothetical protein
VSLRKFLVGVSLVIFCLSMTACTCAGPRGGAGNVSSSAAAESGSVNQKVEKLKLLFFLNPAGQPCQIQTQILSGLSGDLEKKAELVKFQTDRQQDLDMFYRYGVRSLPQLILVDGDMNEKRRFPPGIQNAEQIMGALVGT